MKERYFKNLLFALLLLTGQAAWADGVNHTAFCEAFDINNGSGGRDGKFGGSNIASSNPHFDRDGWSYNQYIKGAHECIRFGTSEQDGVLTTPEIVLLGKKATLTFTAAGWAGGSNSLIVPKYFYMALLHYNKETDTYHSIAFWTDHIDESQSVKNLADYAISIKELEKRTGIDFFCNLPDVIEEDVEAQEPDLEFWKKITRSGE